MKTTWGWRPGVDPAGECPGINPHPFNFQEPAEIIEAEDVFGDVQGDE